MLRKQVLFRFAEVGADAALSVTAAMLLMGGLGADHLSDVCVRAFALMIPLSATTVICSILWNLIRRADDPRRQLRAVAIGWCAVTLSLGVNVVLGYLTVLSTLPSHHFALLTAFILGSIGASAWFMGGALGDRVASRATAPARFTFACAITALLAAYWLERARCFVPFPVFNYAHFALVLLLCWLAASSARNARWVRHRAAAACALLCIVAAFATARLSDAGSQSAYAAMYRLGGFDRRVLRLLRMLRDRDGDGFSPAFGGGDCNDHDSNAYPLGAFDCDGIRPSQSAPASGRVELPAPPGRVNRLLLITIDTLRCDAGGEHLCPEMDRRAATASYRGTQHVFMGRTKASLSALFGLPYVGSPKEIANARNHLIDSSHAVGYRATAFYTLPALGVPALGGSFDEAFTRLGDPAIPALEQVTSARMTDAVLSYLSSHRGGGPWIGWAHFLDPHDPYVPAEGAAPLFTFDRRAAYAVEMKRTDHDVARLIDGALRAGFDKDAAIVVTGDHGENFTPGFTGHGRTSDDVELNVPVAIWLFDRQGNQIPLPLPAELFESDLATTLASLTGTDPPTGQAAVSVVAPLNGDQQFVIFADGWKYVYHRQARYEELFDRRSNPSAHDYSDTRPTELKRMRQALGRALAASPGIARR